LIAGAISLEDAATKALDAFAKLRVEPQAPVVRRPRASAKTLDQLIDEYVEQFKSKVDAGLYLESTFIRKKRILSIHLKPYLKSLGIEKVGQLKQTTFDDYVIGRGGMTTKLTRNTELTEIQAFIYWLVRNEHLKVGIKLVRERVGDDDLTANPAIHPDDWSLITRTIRDWRNSPSASTRVKTRYWRALFHHFCLVMKQTGMRPGELQNLRWKDVEFLSLTDAEEVERMNNTMSSALTDKVATCYIHIRKSKTHSPREVPAKCGRELRRWKDFVFEFVSATNRNVFPKSDDHIFGNCDNYYRPYHYGIFGKTWRELLGSLDLRGHQYSDKEYTIYSMRSTFIEDNLLQDGGCDVFYLARVCGHDVKILQKHYQRITVRTRADELKQIPYGKRQQSAPKTTTLL
jgi:integrase